MTDEELAAMTHAERYAWIDGLSEDERLIVYLPVGYRSELIEASLIKRMLIRTETTAGDRLRLLETLGHMIRDQFPAAAMAAIEPADDVTAEIVREARSLDAEDSHGMASYRMLTSWMVFDHLARLNPSLLDAIRLMSSWPVERKAA
jgi:hypothetical protein